MIREKRKGYVFQAGILAVGLIIAKLIGGLYKIPLINLIKLEGMGIYQVVFPVYALLLNLSSTALPSYISTLIAKNSKYNQSFIINQNAGKHKPFMRKTVRFNDTKAVHLNVKLSNIRRIISIVSAVFAVLMAVFSKSIATLAGESSAWVCFLVISPSLVFVGATAFYRGIFQGKNNMLPSSLSQIFEQVVKVIVGLTLVYYVPGGVLVKVASAILGVTISELFALLFIFLAAKVKKVNIKAKVRNLKNTVKNMMYVALPLSLTFCILPISQIFENGIYLNMTGDLAGFGLFSGGVATLISLPQTVIAGLTTALLPQIARGKDKQNAMSIGLKLTILVAVLSSIVFLFGGKIIVSFLYPKIDLAFKLIFIRLLKICSINCFMLAVLSYINSILIGHYKQNITLFSLVVGSIVKILVLSFLLKYTSLGIYSLAIGTMSCLSLAVILNLVYIIMNARIFREDKRRENYHSRTWKAKRRFNS